MTDLEAIEARQAARERLRSVMSPEWAMAYEDIAGLLALVHERGQDRILWSERAERYREALTFYAEEEEWRWPKGWTGQQVAYAWPRILDDAGAIARSALADLEDPK